MLTCHTYVGISTYTRLMALFPVLARWAGTRKVKPIWILLKQETVSGSGISWATCKSAPRSTRSLESDATVRADYSLTTTTSLQTTTPAPHRSGFYRPDALPVAQASVKSLNKKNKTNKHKSSYLTSQSLKVSVRNHEDWFTTAEFFLHILWHTNTGCLNWLSTNGVVNNSLPVPKKYSITNNNTAAEKY